MKNKIVFFLLIIVCQLSNAQYASKHYIAPSPWQYWSYANEVVISTRESGTISVNLYKSDGTFITNMNVTANTPVSYRFVGTASALVKNAVGTTYSDRGLIVEATSPVLVNLRNIASDSPGTSNTTIKGNASLVSFGNEGVGYSFRLGYYRSSYTGLDTGNPIYSVMAIEDNTTINLNGTTLATLNAGQSRLFTTALGSLLTANKGVVVNVGSYGDTPQACGGNGEDGTVDQVAPVNVLGQNYMVIRGNGTSGTGANHPEQTTVVASEPNTTVTIRNYNSNGQQLGTPITYNLSNAGDFQSFHHGDYTNQYSSTFIQSNNPIVVYSGTAVDCETDISTVLPIGGCAGTTDVITRKFIDYANGDLPYFGYTIIESATEPVLMNGQNLETLTGISRIAIGTTGFYMLRFDNVNIGNPTNIIITSDLRLTTSIVQQGAGFSMSGFFSAFNDTPEPPTNVVVNEDCTFTLITTAGLEPYQWFLDGSPIPDANEDTIIVLETGNYSVQGTRNCGLTLPSLPVFIEVPEPLEVGVPQNKEQCSSVFNLTQSYSELLSTGLDIDNVVITFHTSIQNLENGWQITDESANNNINSYIVSDTQTIYVKVKPLDFECYVVREFQLIVLECQFTAPDNLQLCDDDIDGFEVINLAGYLPDLEAQFPGENYEFGFYESQNNANSQTSPLGASYNASLGTTIIWVRADNLDDTTQDPILDSFIITINSLPQIEQNITDYMLCDSGNGQADFDLISKEQEILDGETAVVSFYTSQVNAINKISPIDTDSIYSISSNQTIWVRAENTYGCYSVTSFDLVILPLGVIPSPNNIELCNNNNQANVSFDLTSVVETVKINPTDVVTFHSTLANANSGISAITSIDNYGISNNQTAYIRVQPQDGSCASISSVNLVILPAPQVNLSITDYELCETQNSEANFDLTSKETEILITGVADITYYHNQSDAINNDDSIDLALLTNYISTGETIWVRAENTNGCYSVTSFELIVRSFFIIDDILPMNVCSDGTSFGTFNLTSKNNEITGGLQGVTVSYHTTLQNAENGNLPLSSPYSGFDTEIIYVRVVNSFGCVSTSDFQLFVNESPIAPVLVPLEYCDPNSDGFGVFDLTEVVSEIEAANGAAVTVTFHETYDAALFGAYIIPNPDEYFNLSKDFQTIYVLITPLGGSDCSTITELNLIVHNLPQITKVVSILNECDDDLDGEAIFDLSDSLSAIMNTLHVSDYTISYHQNESDARGNTSPILGFTSYNSSSGSVWVRVESNDTGCFDVVELELIVHPLPVVSLPEVERYVLCDDNYDGYADFDLASRIADIVNGQSGLTVTFHDTYEDADSKTDAYDINVLHTNNEQTVETVFVRVETEQGCYVITLMDLVVEPLPILFPTDPIEVCDGDTDGLGAVIDFTDTIDQMLNAANPNDYTITIHETYDDAFFKGSSIDDITDYRNIQPFLQVVYLRIESVSGEGCFNIYPITINISPSPQLPIAQDGTLPDLVVCDDNTDGITTFDFTSQTQYILASQVSTTDLLITYHQSEQHAIDGVLAISQVTNYQNLSNPQTIWVRLENTLTGCFDVASFDLIVNLPLEVPFPVPSITLCDEDMDGTITFDLTIRIPDILINTSNPDNFEVEFFTSRLNAINGDLSERIDTPESYLLSIHVQTLGIRVTNKTTGCMSYTMMDIRIAPMPSVPEVALEAMEGCQDLNNPEGFAFFDLTARENFIRMGDTNLIITYHLNLEDAELGQNEIVPADDFLSENRTIYIRVANTPNGGVACARILTVDLLVHPRPVIADNGFEICETNTTGFATFYLRDFNSDLLGPTQNQSDFTIEYYLTQAAANAQTSPPMNQNLGYTNQTQYAEVIWVRITNNATGCSIVDEITLYAEEAAQATQPVNNDIFECDYDGVNDGITSGIDLTVYQNEILGGQDPLQFLVSYHTDEQEANQGFNAVTSPNNFTNTIAGGQTIWVRVENSLTNAPCYALATIELIVEELANPVIDTANDVLCITFGETVAQNPVVLDSGISISGFTFEWYHNGSLVAGATQSTLTLDTLGEEGMYSVIAISPSGCISEPSEDFEVFLSGLPEIVNITTTNAFQDQQDIIVTVQGYGVYAFQLNDGPLQDTGHFTNVPPGTHTVMVYDITSGNINGANSCGNLPIPNIELINYPKFFTPNGDGYNETWNITGLTAFHNAEIYIFDRYGKLLKQLNPEGEGWDGTFNGNQLPSTDYWFKVLYDEQDTRREFKAHFSMKR